MGNTNATSSFQDTSHIVEAVVTNKIRGGYRIKVSVLDLGMYMDGCRLLHSGKEEDGWWFQAPSYRYGNGWKAAVEFDKRKQFYSLLKEKCIEAVQTQEDGSASVEDMSDEALSSQMEQTLSQSLHSGIPDFNDL